MPAAGEVVFHSQDVLATSPGEVFALFGSRCDAGWFFGAVCEQPQPGALVRLDLPDPAHPGSQVEATGRLVCFEPNRLIVIEHETPWRGRVTCTLAPHGGGTRVRLVAEIGAEEIDWLLRARGVPVGDEPSDPGTTPVGLLVSRTGPASVYAAATENLARLAIEEVNADGGVHGLKLRLVVADDGTDAEKGALAARRLVESAGCRAVITNVVSATFRAVEPVVAAAGGLLLYTPVNEGGRFGRRLFRFGERPAGQLRGSIPDLMRLTEAQRWFLAGNDYCWPRETNRCAERIIERSGGTVVGAHYAPLGTRDFAAVLDAIATSSAELVVSTFVGADEAAFERQFYDSGLRGRCRTIAAALDEATREHVGDEAANGIWSVFGYFQQLRTSANASFLARYRKRFGPWAPPVSSLSESVYEAVYLAAEAARRARSWEPDDVATALLHGRYDGPRGPVAVGGPCELRQEMYVAEAVPGGFAVRATC